MKINLIKRCATVCVRGSSYVITSPIQTEKLHSILDLKNLYFLLPKTLLQFKLCYLDQTMTPSYRTLIWYNI